jgi:hypothetical protein
VSLHADAGTLTIELAAEALDAAKLSHPRDRIAALDGEVAVEVGHISARIPYTARSSQG